MIPYEYVDGRGDRVLTDWTADGRQRRAIRHHVRLVLQYDREMGFDSIYFPLDDSERKRFHGIYYAKIRGNPQLRPRLCLGPQNPNEELTYLSRAVERDSKITPKNATKQAAGRRTEVEADNSSRKRIQSRRLGYDG